MKLPNVEDLYPLTPMQELMLLHPDAPGLATQLVYELTGEVEPETLARAFARVMERHPVLRTAFVWDGQKRPLQVVRRRVDLPWERHDLRGLPPDERERAAERILAADRARGFTPARAPLLRWTWLELGPREHRLVWSFHHLLLDGWCLAPLFRETLAIYQALRAGREPSLPRPRPLRDYIAWLERRDPAALEAFWRRHLAGVDAPSPLPGDDGLQGLGAPAGNALRRIHLEAPLTAALQTAAREAGLTLNTFVQGGWSLLLSSACGGLDVVFGITVSGRPASLPGVESIIGPFLNNLPVRVRVEPETPLAGWLRRIQEDQAEMRQHEYAALPQIQSWSGVPSGLRLFDSLVVFESFPVNGAELDPALDLTVRNVGGDLATGYPLTLVAAPGAEMLLQLSYDPRRFAAGTVEALLQTMRDLLARMAAAPEAPVGELAATIDRRWELRGAAPRTRSEPGERPGFVSPRDTWELRVAAIWEDLLGVRPVGVKDSFFDLGGHSLLAYQLLRRIRDELGASLPPSLLGQAATVEKLAEALRRQDGHAGSSPLVPIRPGGRRPPFFCVHPGPGSVFCYLDLARHLGDDQPFWGLQARGLDGEQEPISSVEEMAALYLAAIRGVQAEGPYRLGGHSFGGIVAFEMARQLRAAGEEVALLAILDTPPPLMEASGVVVDDSEWAAGFARLVGRFYGKDVALAPEDLQGLAPDERLERLLVRLREADLLPPDADLSVVRGFERVQRAHNAAYLSYRPGPYDGPITLFRAGRAVSGEELASGERAVSPWRGLLAARRQLRANLAGVKNAWRLARIQNDPAFGWSGLTVRPVEAHVVPGAHFTMLTEPHAGELASRLAACLEAASTASREGARRESMSQQVAPPRGMKAFTRIWLGQLVSLTGSSLTLFALGVWVYQKTGSVTQFAFISLFGILPTLLVSPLAGALVDRWDRRGVMILSDAAAALGTATLWILLATDRLAIGHIYGLVLFMATCAAFQRPAYAAATGALVGAEHLGRANGMTQGATAISQLVAPVLAGFLLGLIHFRGIVLVDIATFFLALGTLLATPIPAPKRSEEAGKKSLLAGAGDGWAYLRARPGLLGLLAFFAAANFLVAVVSVLATPLVLSFASPAALGTVLSVGGLGMVVGSVVMSAWGGPKRRAQGVQMPLLFCGVFLALCGLRPSVLLVAAGAFLFFAAVPLVNSSIRTTFQAKVPQDLHGRVFALVQMIAGSVSPLAFVLAGPLADRVFEPLLAPNGGLAGSLGSVIGVGPGRGIGLLFILSGLLLVVLALWGFLDPRLRRLDETVPDLKDAAAA